MVDWATQNRLYPPGYRSVEVRYPDENVNVSLSLPVTSNRGHNCGLKTTRSKNIKNNRTMIDNLYGRLNQAFAFHANVSADNENDQNPKLIATYGTSINWPRSVCCLSAHDGSLIVCEQERCRLLLFTPQLMLRSTCGGRRGNGVDEFDSPWSVTSLNNNSSSPRILVADTNNLRVQCFGIEFDGQFSFKYTLTMLEKPYFVSTSKHHFAVSCEKGVINTFSTKEKKQIAIVNMKKISTIRNSFRNALPLCLDNEHSFLFVTNPVQSESLIHQLTITGEYLRAIKLDGYPFLRMSSLVFDDFDQRLIVADSFNCLVYSVEHDLDEDNVEIILKRSDNLNSPQALCVSNEGHLLVVECSVTTKHALKMFHYHPCLCHTSSPTSSVKTSETTSVRSLVVQY